MVLGRTLSVAERVIEAAPDPCPSRHASIAGVSRTTAAHGFTLVLRGGSSVNSISFNDVTTRHAKDQKIMVRRGVWAIYVGAFPRGLARRRCCQSRVQAQALPLL